MGGRAVGYDVRYFCPVVYLYKDSILGPDQDIRGEGQSGMKT